MAFKIIVNMNQSFLLESYFYFTVGIYFKAFFSAILQNTFYLSDLGSG